MIDVTCSAAQGLCADAQHHLPSREEHHSERSHGGWGARAAGGSRTVAPGCGPCGMCPVCGPLRMQSAFTSALLTKCQLLLSVFHTICSVSTYLLFDVPEVPQIAPPTNDLYFSYVFLHCTDVSDLTASLAGASMA